MTHVAIVGGGLSGLALAERLHIAGVPFSLFEARNRFGGRILSLDRDGLGVDMGPSWFWPGQPLMSELITRSGLEVFEQHALGDALFEDSSGQIQQGRGFASMRGSLRVKGGMGAIIAALLARLPAERLHLGAQVIRVTPNAVHLGQGQSALASHIVLTCPPRVAQGLTFDPALTQDQWRALGNVPTWMAGHAKFQALYENAFWRDAGLSGDAVSQRGPLAEIHDSSGSQEALFGFVGVPASARRGREKEIKAAAVAQLVRLFGPEAATPAEVLYKDWSVDPSTAGPGDDVPPQGHPAYGRPAALHDLWAGRLMFGSTEMAARNGGLMEGALESARTLAQEIIHG